MEEMSTVFKKARDFIKNFKVTIFLIFLGILLILISEHFSVESFLDRLGEIILIIGIADGILLHGAVKRMSSVVKDNINKYFQQAEKISGLAQKHCLVNILEPRGSKEVPNEKTHEKIRDRITTHLKSDCRAQKAEENIKILRLYGISLREFFQINGWYYNNFLSVLLNDKIDRKDFCECNNKKRL